ncbi:MAG: ABC transporter ATP-binding protein [Lachnospiraceae bacterium]|nr:ABC transporter ATP-binding protein [Lachnospiraceae bacterium]
MIQLIDVSFRYKGAAELNLKKISLHIKKGECVLISGRSGCGKTTILRLINGLIPHYYEGEIEGSVLIEGKNIETMEMYEIAEHVGTIYQNPRAQFFNIDSDSEILFGIENLAYPRKKLKERFEKTVQETGVKELLGKNLFWLSGGEKQKIAFASVYAMQPEIYLMDEPSANLDAAAVKKLQNQISRLKKQGKTVVITEHRLHYLRNLVDRILYVENGEIQREYLAEQFFNLSVKERIEKGLRTVNVMENDVLVKSKEDKILAENHSSIFMQIQNVGVSYQKQEIIHNISFNAKAGEVIAVTGKNGAGKSTLVEALCGLHEIKTGNITINGRTCKEKQRCQAGYMVFQDVDFQLFADSVRRECTYGLKNIKQEQVSQILEELKLEELEDKHPALLSGGQKQRLAVAVSLLCGKEILIFDEPTSGLDYDNMCRVSSLIQELSQKGKIIFIVTHDYELVCRVCDRMLLLDRGTLIDDIKACNNLEQIKEILV